MPDESRAAAPVPARDARLAARLAEGLGRDGWRVGWSGPVDGPWEAFVGSPSMAVPARARGLTRVSAITGAHLGAIRRVAGLGPIPERAPLPETCNKKSEFLDMNDRFDLA